MITKEWHREYFTVMNLLCVLIMVVTVVGVVR